MTDSSSSNPKPPYTEEEKKKIRDEIRQNLITCCESWPIEDLLALEKFAGCKARAFFIYYGQEFIGLQAMRKRILNQDGSWKLTTDPDSEDNFFRVMAEFLREEARIQESL